MSSQPSSLADRLKKFDAQSSVSKEFRVHTSQGAVLSVLTILAIGYLIHTEFNFNFSTTILERVHVNASTPAGLEMEFDITLPHVPCVALSIDAHDPNGQPQSLHLDRQHHVWKHRIDKDGSWLGRRSRMELGNTIRDEEHLKETVRNLAMAKLAKDLNDISEEDEDEACGSCYGAGDEGECCNSCEDVKRAYKRKGWMIYDNAQIKQCAREMTADDQAGEGCNVHGIIALSTGGGNVHLAPGHSNENFGKDVSIFDMFLQTFERWNVSHQIHQLRFGAEFPGSVQQLDGVNRNIGDSHGMYQYYFQIVPTKYKFLNGTTIQTNQYSVTEHLRHVNPGGGRGLPGVFFFYEVSALHVEIVEHRRGWVQFFTSVCAVIGGVVTVMGLFDQYLYSLGQRQKKNRLIL